MSDVVQIVKILKHCIVFCLNCLLLLVVVSCVDNRLEEALSLSKDNRSELENVLEQYENDPLKKRAAHFLITNMIGHSGPDSIEVATCNKFCEEYDSLSRIYQYEASSEWGRKVDHLWKRFDIKTYSLIDKTKKFDLETLKADFIINEIDMAFKAWNENIYTHECAFDDFCEYILPYRRKNGVLSDQKRFDLYQKYHEHFFSQPGKDFIEETDSLLKNYSFVTHSLYYGMEIPIFSFTQMEYMRHGLCEDRCWFNVVLLSSLGMAAAVDFVPKWASRNESHSWNVLIVNGKSYAFEPFWDTDRWKYKRIYNNETYDTVWGRFRLSKVFRKTYGIHVDDILKDNKIDIDDIPELFRDIRKKDVSHEYFDTVNVRVALSNIPDDERYAYLCTFNAGQWNPVQWAKIEGKTAEFKGMGRNVVYLPAYYRKGAITFAGDPFLLKQDGSQEKFDATLKGDGDSVILRHNLGDSFQHLNNWHHKKMAGAVLTGDVTLQFESADTICTFPQNSEFYRNALNVNPQRKIRYVRMTLPLNSIALNELDFIAKNGKRISNVHFVQQMDTAVNGEKPDYVLDGLSGTGFSKLGIENGYIDIDLGNMYELSEVQYIPYHQILLDHGVTYELFYWKEGWKFLESMAFNGKPLLFHKIPDKALLLVRPKVQTKRISYRPFSYVNDEIQWY